MVTCSITEYHGLPGKQASKQAGLKLKFMEGLRLFGFEDVALQGLGTKMLEGPPHLAIVV